MSSFSSLADPPAPMALAVRARRRTFALPFELVLAAAVGSLILMAMPRTMADPDIWWHLRNASVLLSHPVLIAHDSYSFTAAGAPWIDHEWLSELLFYAGWRLGGAGGVFAVTALLVQSIFAGVFVLAWKASRSGLVAAVATVAAALLATVSFGPRTLLTGWLCLVVQLLLLEAARHRPRLLYALPPLYVFWVNLHGSWMIGLVVLLFGLLLPLLPFGMEGRGPWAAEWIAPEPWPPESRRLFLPVGAGVLAALFANPWSYRLVLYPFNFAFRQTLNVANVEEWRALDLHTLRGRVVVAVVALVVLRQLWRPRRWALRELAMVGLGLYSAFCYSRFLFLLALLAAQPFARSFARQAGQRMPGRQHVLGNAALLVLIGVFAAACLHRGSRRDEPLAAQYPSAAALAALDHLGPHVRVFNEFLWGGYLEWTRPKLPVLIDSRVDLFEYNGTFRDYLDIVHLVRAEPLLDRYRIDAVFFEPDTPLVLLLRRSGAWVPVYQDAHAILLVRAHPLQG